MPDQVTAEKVRDFFWATVYLL